MIEQDHNFYLMTLSVLNACLLHMYGYESKKLQVNHLWSKKV